MVGVGALAKNLGRAADSQDHMDHHEDAPESVSELLTGQAWIKPEDHSKGIRPRKRAANTSARKS